MDARATCRLLAPCLVTLLAVAGGCGNDFVLASSGSGAASGSGVASGSGSGAASGSGGASSTGTSDSATSSSASSGGPMCGDEVVDGGEQCDDGNLDADDGCDPSCKVECDESQDHVYDDVTHHCYHFVSASVDWASAEDACAEHGPGWHLATITSEDELNFIDDVVDATSDAWIGATDVDVEGDFEWVTGEPFDYANWEDTSPNGGDGANCLELETKSGIPDEIDDEDCAINNDYLCELTPAGTL